MGAETPAKAFETKPEEGKKTKELVFNPEYDQDVKDNAELKGRVAQTNANFEGLKNSLNKVADSKLGYEKWGIKVLEGVVGIDEHNQIASDGEALLNELRSQEVEELKSVFKKFPDWKNGMRLERDMDSRLAEKVNSMDGIAKMVMRDGNIDLGLLRATVETRRKSPDQLLAEDNAATEAVAKKAADEAAAKEAARKAAEPQKPTGRFEGVEGMENAPDGFMKKRGGGEGTPLTGPDKIK